METEEILVSIQKAADTIATPNWAAIASVVISLLAVIVAAGVAIYIAQKQNKITERQTEIALKQAEIAEQQNRIALFEKRFLVFSEISKVIRIGQAISAQPKASLKWVLDTALVNFGYGPTIDTQDTKKILLDFIVVSHNLTAIQQAVFLFPEIEKEDVNKLCDKFLRFFCEMIVKVGTHPDATIEQFTSATKSNFIAVSEEFNTKYHTLIVQNLYLTR